MSKLDALHIVSQPGTGHLNGGAGVIGQMLYEATKHKINWLPRNPIKAKDARIRVLYPTHDPWPWIKTPKLIHAINEVLPKRISIFNEYTSHDTIVTVAEHTWNLLNPLFSNVELIENVARPWFTPGPKSPDLVRNKPVAIYCGQFSYGKGTHTLIEAISTLDCELWLLGSGMPIKKHPNIKVIGVKYGDELLKYLRSADIFVFPSQFEGMSLALLEAMAVGLPCVVTNIPGNLDTCKKAALYVDNTVESLRNGIIKLMGSEQFQKDLSGLSLELSSTRKYEEWGERFISIIEKATLL